MVCSQEDLAALRESTDLPHLRPEQKIVRSCEEKECSDQS